MELKRINERCVEFNGVVYRRYPNIKGNMRNYYIWTKYQRGLGINKQKRLHREIWKFHNGDIPKGYVIHHIDSNTENNNIENLQCMSNSEHCKLHQKIIKHKIDFEIKKCIICKNNFETSRYKKIKTCSKKCLKVFMQKKKIT